MADGVDVQDNGEEVQADEDLVDIAVEFKNVEVGRILDANHVDCELIGVGVINEEQDEGVDLQDDGYNIQDDGVDMQADGVDMQGNEVDMQADGHNIHHAVAPARVRTRRQSKILVMRKWNRKPMLTVNGEGTTP
ncbi:hypothetical protein Tco_1479899 [Tanacetum coccineum]